MVDGAIMPSSFPVISCKCSVGLKIRILHLNPHNDKTPEHMAAAYHKKVHVSASDIRHSKVHLALCWMLTLAQC